VILVAVPTPTRASTTNAPSGAAISVPLAPVVFADIPWHKQAYDTLAHWLSSRTRMIQFAVVGMIIALVVIMFFHKW
jgi:hypothetical protein